MYELYEYNIPLSIKDICGYEKCLDMITILQFENIYNKQVCFNRFTFLLYCTSKQLSIYDVENLVQNNNIYRNRIADPADYLVSTWILEERFDCLHLVDKYKLLTVTPDIFHLAAKINMPCEELLFLWRLFCRQLRTNQHVILRCCQYETDKTNEAFKLLEYIVTNEHGLESKDVSEKLIKELVPHLTFDRAYYMAQIKYILQHSTLQLLPILSKYMKKHHNTMNEL